MLRVKVVAFYADQVFKPFGVPQDSVLGHILFAIYMQLVRKIIKHRNLQYHQYADDKQLYKAPNANHLSLIIKITQECICDLKSWMTKNRLQLYEPKTESKVCYYLESVLILRK